MGFSLVNVYNCICRAKLTRFGHDQKRGRSVKVILSPNVRMFFALLIQILSFVGIASDYSWADDQVATNEFPSCNEIDRLTEARRELAAFPSDASCTDQAKALYPNLAVQIIDFQTFKQKCEKESRGAAAVQAREKLADAYCSTVNQREECKRNAIKLIEKLNFMESQSPQMTAEYDAAKDFISTYQCSWKRCGFFGIGCRYADCKIGERRVPGDFLDYCTQLDYGGWNAPRTPTCRNDPNNPGWVFLSTGRDATRVMNIVDSYNENAKKREAQLTVLSDLLRGACRGKRITDRDINRAFTRLPESSESGRETIRRASGSQTR